GSRCEVVATDFIESTKGGDRAYWCGERGGKPRPPRAFGLVRLDLGAGGARGARGCPLLGAAEPPGRQPVAEDVGRQRAAEVVSLGRVGAELGETLLVLGGLDAFSDNVEPEAAPQLHGGAHDGGVLVMGEH